MGLWRTETKASIVPLKTVKPESLLRRILGFFKASVLMRPYAADPRMQLEATKRLMGLKVTIWETLVGAVQVEARAEN